MYCVTLYCLYDGTCETFCVFGPYANAEMAWGAIPALYASYTQALKHNKQEYFEGDVMREDFDAAYTEMNEFAIRSPYGLNNAVLRIGGQTQILVMVTAMMQDTTEKTAPHASGKGTERYAHKVE